MSPTTRTPSRTVHESYSARGLLTYAAIVPAFVALLVAPVLVLSFALGALTAVLLNRALGLL
jgi:hypothetical protein